MYQICNQFRKELKRRRRNYNLLTGHQIYHRLQRDELSTCPCPSASAFQFSPNPVERSLIENVCDYDRVGLACSKLPVSSGHLNAERIEVKSGSVVDLLRECLLHYKVAG